MFRKVADYLGCPKLVKVKDKEEWEVIESTRFKNSITELLLEGTHSDEKMEIFVKDNYNEIKQEKTFNAFIFN